jgi:hypothetical protein
MERTVPTTETEEVELYTRTYYSLLRSSAEVKIRSLEEVHAGMNSLMHPAAREPYPDMSAFLYSVLRLPACMPEVRLVVLGQNARVFETNGFGDMRKWQEVTAPARRRRCFFDGKDTLACFIASRSDIDDIIPILTAYQIEWNKLHFRLQRIKDKMSLKDIGTKMASANRLVEQLEIPEEDFERLYAIWDRDLVANLGKIAENRCDLRIHLLSSSMSEYRRSRNAWWEAIENTRPDITERPVYFVSSNTHSLANILSGFALQKEAQLVQFLDRPGNSGLRNEWRDIQKGAKKSSRENFLYYLLKRSEQNPEGHKLLKEQIDHERILGIQRITSRRVFDVEAQIIDLSKLDFGLCDPRLKMESADGILQKSEALVLNIDYPLGLAAYDILAEVSSHVGSVLGVYVMGKAATLNAVIGDVMISNVVHDEHSRNTYLFQNCFTAADVIPNLIYGTVLDNQKTVTVQGTFLQTEKYMDVFYREGYTVIEMESGPYLSAVYEMHRPDRHPVNEIINLYGLGFDIGLVHYASDTPMGKGKNLGAGSLSYFGMDPAYAVSLAILRRIFELERRRLKD